MLLIDSVLLVQKQTLSYSFSCLCLSFFVRPVLQLCSFWFCINGGSVVRPSTLAKTALPAGFQAVLWRSCAASASRALPAGRCWPGLGGVLLSCGGLAFNVLLLLAVRARAVPRACLVCAAASRRNCSWLEAHPWLWLLSSCLVPRNGP